MGKSRKSAAQAQVDLDNKCNHNHNSCANCSAELQKRANGVMAESNQRLREENKELREENKELREENAQFLAQQEKLRKVLDKNILTIRALEKELKDTKESNTALSSRNEELQREVEELLSAKQEQCLKALQVQNKLQEELDEIKTKLESANETNAQLKAALDQKQNEPAQAKTDVQNLLHCKICSFVQSKVCVTLVGVLMFGGCAYYTPEIIKKPMIACLKSICEKYLPNFIAQSLGVAHYS